MTLQLHNGDCLEVMKSIPDQSVGMILCDLPYGTTACAWDVVIPFADLWTQYRRVVKTKGAVVLTAAQPFTSALIASNLDWFKYCWYWNKAAVTGFANAKRQPLRNVEEVCVFSSGQTIYNAQGLVRIDRVVRNGSKVGGETMRRDLLKSEGKGVMRTPGTEYVQEFSNWPRQTLDFGRDRDKVHPTQKPVALIEYLIRTYTNEGDVVMDNCMGSGTTGVACVNTNRGFIGIERDPDYFKIAETRIADAFDRWMSSL